MLLKVLANLPICSKVDGTRHWTHFSPPLYDTRVCGVTFNILMSYIIGHQYYCLGGQSCTSLWKEGYGFISPSQPRLTVLLGGDTQPVTPITIFKILDLCTRKFDLSSAFPMLQKGTSNYTDQEARSSRHLLPSAASSSYPSKMSMYLAA